MNTRQYRVHLTTKCGCTHAMLVEADELPPPQMITPLTNNITGDSAEEILRSVTAKTEVLYRVFSLKKDYADIGPEDVYEYVETESACTMAWIRHQQMPAPERSRVRSPYMEWRLLMRKLFDACQGSFLLYVDAALGMWSQLGKEISGESPHNADGTPCQSFQEFIQLGVPQPITREQLVDAITTGLREGTKKKLLHFLNEHKDMPLVPHVLAEIMFDAMEQRSPHAELRTLTVALVLLDVAAIVKGTLERTAKGYT